jgi:hypothetical protein
LLERRPCSTKVDSWASANSTTELVKIDQFFDALGRRPHRRGLAGGCWWAPGGNHGDRRRWAQCVGDHLTLLLRQRAVT